MNNHTETFTKQFDNGDTFHCRIQITRGIENNADKWMIAYYVNGRGYQYELFAGYGARHQLNYARGIDNAVTSAKMRIDRVIDKLHPPEVWVCPKPTPIPSAIVPYGSLFAPVTYAPPQAVTVAPVADDAFRQRLHNEMVTMVSVRYAPIGGGLSRWLAVATFENMEVHFPIYREHAAKFLQAGFAQLPKGTDVKPFATEINVILEWNEVRHDLRIWAVLDKQGQPHKVGERRQRVRIAMPDLRTFKRGANNEVVYPELNKADKKAG